jgi:hypothetical protein
VSVTLLPRYARSREAARDSVVGSRLLAAAVIVGLMVGLYLGLTSERGPRVLFEAKFGGHGLVTNEYAYHNSGDPHALRSSQWVATSGSLFASGGAGWSGIPDGRAPDSTSSNATDSSVFRLRTRADHFENVAVAFELRIARLVTTPRTPAQAYDGVHVWLRYQTPNWLYFASVSRRDNVIVIGKKLPAATGGVYTDLVRVPGHAFPRDRWESVRVTIQSVGGKEVVIRVFVAGKLLARTVDTGHPSSAIRRPGRVGIRGDNAEFEFRDFKVSTV